MHYNHIHHDVYYKSNWGYLVKEAIEKFEKIQYCVKNGYLQEFETIKYMNNGKCRIDDLLKKHDKRDIPEEWHNHTEYDPKNDSVSDYMLKNQNIEYCIKKGYLHKSWAKDIMKDSIRDIENLIRRHEEK